MESEIQYHPSAEQLALAGTIEESLAELLPLSRVHRAHEEDHDTWAQLEEIGIFAMGVPEASGGSGLGAAEEALIGMALARSITSLLYGVSAVDPLILGVTAAIVLAVALLASILPARRAMRVDPLVALRYE